MQGANETKVRAISVSSAMLARAFRTAYMLDSIGIGAGFWKSDHAQVKSYARANMTTTFDKREEGFEKQFAHDEELRFKAMARRNKMLGLWAAGILGKTGADAEAYAKEVVMADFESGDKDVVHKVITDLQPKGITEQQIRSQMVELLSEAIAQIKKSG
jgi:hypothetical protein